MMRNVKKDWSSDLGYSSLNQDKKAWKSKGFFTSRTDRQAVNFPSMQSVSVPTAMSHTKKIGTERMYDPKPELVDNVTRSPVKYAIHRSAASRDLDVNALRNSDTRHMKTRSPYKVPLGPGSYLSERIEETKVRTTEGMQSSSKGLSNFLAKEREGPHMPDLPALSDTLTRDKRRWTSRGFYSSRSARTRNTVEFWQSGAMNNPQKPTGGLLEMAQKNKVPAFDTMYDKQKYANIQTDVAASPMLYSGSFKSLQARTVHQPKMRSNDSRLRSQSSCMGETDGALGPGTYEYPTTVDGRTSPPSMRVRGLTTGELFNNSFRGPPRFFPKNGAGQPMSRDSQLMKTW